MPNTQQFKTAADIARERKARQAQFHKTQAQQAKQQAGIDAALDWFTGDSQDHSVQEICQMYAAHLASQVPVVQKAQKAYEALAHLAEQVMDEDPAESRRISDRALEANANAGRLHNLHVRWKMQEMGF